MSDPLAKLLDHAGEPLIADQPRFRSLAGVPACVAELLARRNGFYAFASSLHVFPGGTLAGVMDVETWNEPTLWRAEYDDRIAGFCFFAEDAFGEQFGAGDDGTVRRLNPETGELVLYAPDVGAWAQRILADHRVETGWPLAMEWQEINGPLPAGRRLLPTTPFVLGGEFSLGNLWAGDAVEGMRFRAYLAKSIEDVPDGKRVKLVVREEGKP